MNYTTETEINAPIEKVASLFGDHEEMLKWMKELDSYEPISGKPRHPGTKTLLRLNAGPDVNVVETILEVEPPHRFVASYEMEHGTLHVENQLQALGANATKHIMLHRFEFNGMLKVAAALMKPAFLKHSQGMMEKFKERAERS